MPSVRGVQDQPYGTLSTVTGVCTFSDGQSGVVANGQVLTVSWKDYVISALATNGLTCTLTPTPSPDLTNVGFNYGGREVSIRG